MKTSDIQVGEEYALAENYEWDPNPRWYGAGERRARRVVVKETRVGRKVWRGFDSTEKKDGVRVQLLDNDTGQPLEPSPVTGRVTRVVLPRNIRMTWAEWEPIMKEMAQEKIVREEKLHTAHDQAVKDITDLLGEGWPDLERLLPAFPSVKKVSVPVDLLVEALKQARSRGGDR